MSITAPGDRCAVPRRGLASSECSSSASTKTLSGRFASLRRDAARDSFEPVDGLRALTVRCVVGAEKPLVERERLGTEPLDERPDTLLGTIGIASSDSGQPSRECFVVPLDDTDEVVVVDKAGEEFCSMRPVMSRRAHGRRPFARTVLESVVHKRGET